MSAKGGLGRGLSSLIPTKKLTPSGVTPAQAGAQTSNVMEIVPEGERILHVPVGDIVPNPHQPRREFHAEELEELVSSVKEYGILQPLIVTEKGNGMFELIAGERRLRAARAAGLKKVPVIVRSADELRKFELALIENLQREDLSPVEEALAYAKLMDEFGMTQEAVSQKVGKSRSVVANTLRLLNLPQDMQQALSDSQISMSMARVLCGMENPAEQRAMFERMLKGEYTVREAEDASRLKKNPGRVRAQMRDVNVMAMEEDLRDALGTKVVIKKRGETGKIMIEFYSQEELNGLANRLKG